MPDPTPQPGLALGQPNLNPSPSPQPGATPTPSPTPEPQKPADGTSQTTSLLNEPTEGKDPKAAAPEGAPEAYTDFQVPDGYTLDKEVAGEATALFKELNLPQAQAQRLIDLYSKHAIAAEEAALAHWKDTQDTWVQQIKADPEIGGKLDQVKTTVSRAIDAIAGPELGQVFKQAMDATGAGNHPAFVKVLFKMAGLLTEGSHVPGQNPSPNNDPARQGRTPAERMYPSLPRSA